MTKFILVALGGGLGALCRFAVASVSARPQGELPIATIAVNVVGCLLIGFLGTLFTTPPLVRDELRFFVLVGLLGGFTTFSTYGYETFSLLEAQRFATAAANVVASNVLGLLAVWWGFRLAQAWQST